MTFLHFNCMPKSHTGSILDTIISIFSIGSNDYIHADILLRSRKKSLESEATQAYGRYTNLLRMKFDVNSMNKLNSLP